MTDLHSTALNERINELMQTTQKHEVEIKLNTARLEQHEKQFRKLHDDLSTQHTGLMTEIKKIGNNVGQLSVDYHRREGAESASKKYHDRTTRQYRMLFGLIGAMGAIAAVIMLFK